MDGAKRCPYCCRAHTRRARACSKWCERKIGGRSAWVTRSRREAAARSLAAIVKAGDHRSRWRKIAMGQDESAELSKVFGVQLSLSETCAMPELRALRQVA